MFHPTADCLTSNILRYTNYIVHELIMDDEQEDFLAHGIIDVDVGEEDLMDEIVHRKDIAR